ncbi:MAG: cytochrome C, partial [Bacteroidetes bacterium]
MLKYFTIRIVLLFLASIFFFSLPTAYAQDNKDGKEAPKKEGGGADTTAKQEPAKGVADAGGISADDAVIAKGLDLFNGNCKQCHAVNKQVVGPQLSGVYNRQSIPWLINFIKYPQKVIESGDAHAVELYQKYKQYMPNHDFLKDADILAILSYVKKETENPSGGNGDGTTTLPMSLPTEAESDNSGIMTFIALGLGVLLLLVMGVLLMMSLVLSKYIKKSKNLSEEDIEVVSQTINWGKIFRSQAFVGFVAFFFVAIVGKTTLDGFLSLGVQKGYAPEQPIPFSHKLHAGEYGIDCKYCHTTVEKSKNANIPSANICMNCHNSIKTTSPNMQKIYDAIEKDEPIQWVRVHNLPDLSYFNHAQHVKVGGLECENCHGNIKGM